MNQGDPVLVSDVPENLEIAGEGGPRFRIHDADDLARAGTGSAGFPDWPAAAAEAWRVPEAPVGLEAGD